MTGTMYFGTRGFMQEVPAPSIDPDYSKVGYTQKFQYLNGGAGLRSSKASHKEYLLSWNVGTRDELRPILDFADGIYDTHDGVNLIYIDDLMASGKNALPQLAASPAQGYADDLSLFPGQRPTISATPTNTLGYPARSATFTHNLPSQTVWIPLRPGCTAWVGFHGSVTGDAAVTVKPTVGLTDGAAVELTPLAVTDDTRVNQSFDSTTCDGIILGFNNLGPAATDTSTISGIMVQILETGITPETGGFISGQGNSGCVFEGQPSQTPRSAVMDQIAVSAKLVEVGSWL